ncbi:hemerythrin domain-containing protein [Paraconexibacter antarcticus]|uniref:hemerythrin domain-containing protein n=1 Tax=Paraconexibacter antarcticus TaxID=2949664 RepID=UPI003460C1D6
MAAAAPPRLTAGARPRARRPRGVRSRHEAIERVGRASREHHVALELALRLQRATEADAAELRVGALGFWRDEGREHFRLEEELLLPAFAAHVGGQDADVDRVLAEHADIRRRIDELEPQRTPEVAALTSLGEVLRDHVRHEERTLFGRVEAALDDEQLAALGAALESAGGEHRPPRA